ncbi:MAG: hypothetical protein U0793_05190 [Gemmataceae bacterium]
MVTPTVGTRQSPRGATPAVRRRIGVGIDTSRYGHYAVFLRDNLEPARASDG